MDEIEREISRLVGFGKYSNQAEIRILFKELINEIKRLKDGDLDTTELDNICHNLQDKDKALTRSQHEHNCLALRDKIWGK